MSDASSQCMQKMIGEENFPLKFTMTPYVLHSFGLFSLRLFQTSIKISGNSFFCLFLCLLSLILTRIAFHLLFVLF